MGKKAKWAILVVAVVGIGSTLAMSAAKRGNKATEVRMETVQKRDLVASVTASGQVRPQTKVDVASDVSGKIIKLAVREGQMVKAGDFLLQIDQEQPQAAVQRAEAALASMRAQLAQSQANLDQSMRTFDRTRPWIAAGAAGIIRRALEESRKYALERKTFGVPIAQHQAVQFMLAEMAIAYEATRLLCHKAAAGIDSGKPDSIVSSYAKAYSADAAMRVSTDAVQIFGGYGYTKEYPVEKLMRDAKLLQIYEGTSQIQRMVIARNVLGG